MSTASTFLNSSIDTLRRTRRAYIGAHVMAFEFAQKRAANRLSQVKALSEMLVVKGEAVEADAASLFGAAKGKVVEVMPFVGEDEAMIDVTPKKVKKAKAPKRADMSTDRLAKSPTQPKAKPKTKAKTVAKKTAKPVAKTKVKTDITPAKTETKAATQAGKVLTDRYAPYEVAVAKYEADANPVHIKKIVDHLGVALNSRDGKFVACSDPAERETVAKSWLLKKLGVEADMDALDAKVGAVCDTMKADRLKPRVTFYYLLAKNEGKLGVL